MCLILVLEGLLGPKTIKYVIFIRKIFTGEAEMNNEGHC